MAWTMTNCRLLIIVIAAVSVAKIAAFQQTTPSRAENNGITKQILPSFTPRQTPLPPPTTHSTALHLHPDQAAELQEAAEQFIISCKKDTDDMTEHADTNSDGELLDTARRRYEDDTSTKHRGGGASAASASSSIAAPRNLAGRSFAFCRSLLSRRTR